MKQEETMTENQTAESMETGTVPGLDQIEKELKRVRYKRRFRQLLRSTIEILIVVAACAVLVAVLFMPVLRIYGSSMNPTLNEKDIVVSVKSKDVKTGDIIGIYYGSKLLIKRCIASEHQWVDLDQDGNVYVDGVLLEESYLPEGAKDFGLTNIELPYQVPDTSVFVMGDNRATSVDSRNSAVGAIDTENIVGRIVFRVWPFERFGFVVEE